MRTLSILLLALLAMGSGMAIAQTSYDLKSPDGRIEVRIRTARQIRYDVVLRGTSLLENASLSLDVEHKKLGIEPKVVNSKQRSSDEIVEPVVRQKFAKIRDHYNELRLDNGRQLRCRLSRVQRRCRVPFRDFASRSADVKVYGEDR